MVSVDRTNLSVAKELFGLEPASFTIIPNGVSEVSQYRPLLERRGAALRIGFVGVVQEGKGWHLVAEAVDHLAKRGIGVQFTIAGAGPEAESARAWCAARSQYASYLGHVPEPAKTLMPKLDVLCLMSRVEGLPMVVLEAMANGVAVVSTPVGGIPSVVESGTSGPLVDAIDFRFGWHPAHVPKSTIRAITHGKSVGSS